MALVALRLGIGWHFFKEGATKIQEPGWTAAGFLNGAKGPLAPYFALMVWDNDGRARLNYVESDSGSPKIDLKKTLEVWDQYRVRVEKHYKFDDKQKKRAAACLAHWERQLKWYFGQHEDKIIEYFHRLERREANRGDPAHREVASLRGQAQTVEAELKSERAPWLAQIEKLWQGYSDELNALATREQAKRGVVVLGKPARGWMDTLTIDRIIPYFDTIVGLLLIAGLFTRTASIAAAVFLFSIVLTQWPGAQGAVPVYYQSIEMLALLVLAATAAGRFAGLDFIVHSVCLWFKTSKQGTN